MSCKLAVSTSPTGARVALAILSFDDKEEVIESGSMAPDDAEILGLELVIAAHKARAMAGSA